MIGSSMTSKMDQREQSCGHRPGCSFPLRTNLCLLVLFLVFIPCPRQVTSSRGASFVYDEKILTGFQVPEEIHHEPPQGHACPFAGHGTGSYHGRDVTANHAIFYGNKVVLYARRLVAKYKLRSEHLV